MSHASSSATYDYRALEEAYIARNPTSRSIYDEAVKALPGGNTRSVLYYAPFPLSVSHAEGSRIYDADGHGYVDFLGEFTAGLYGHSEPVMVDAIKQAVDRGLSFGSQHEDEAKLANAVKKRFESIDLLRFTNSGTEATLMALALAKAFTGKQRILVFSGGYHGGAFSFRGGKSSPVNVPHQWLIAQYNSIESVHDLLETSGNKEDLAAILLEPMIGSGGAIPADHGFLANIRRVANEHGAVLIYDEVMTSRLYAGSGIQSQIPQHDRPDLTTLGKWIGGGLSFGAFGGKAKIMQLFNPRQTASLSHAGTFNNNVLTMAAGRAGIEKVFTPEKARELHDRGEKLRQRLQEISVGSMLQWTGLGSIMNVTFTTVLSENIRCPEDFGHPDTVLGDLLHLFLLERGYHIARRGFVALSLALSQADIDSFVSAVADFVQAKRPMVALL